ncbi:MAG: CDP-glucose 4,6-dehydratase [Rickettsiales bacterium]|nr:CDP-glucose 4,6-dehydratase [Rickettsiales bacterium]
MHRPDPDFWRGRRVLVTGASGFKGSWLVLALRELGAVVTGLSLPPPQGPSHFVLAGVDAELDHCEVDVRDYGAVAEVVKKARVEVVFHLAAQALVFAGYADPIGTYGSNIMGTVHLLEALRHSPGVRVLVNVTTDKVYADAQSQAHVEGGRLGGADPYSASKACSELVTAASASWAVPAGLMIATARSGNTLGGGDWAANRLVPDAVRAAQDRRSLSLRCPTAVRPWQFVLDSLGGYLLLAQALHSRDDGESFVGGWNFSPGVGCEPTVVELATALAEALGAPCPVVEDQPETPAETAILRLDSSKAREHLGWQPSVDWRGCVEQTARWYRVWLDGADVGRESRSQVRGYLAG